MYSATSSKDGQYSWINTPKNNALKVASSEAVTEEDNVYETPQAVIEEDVYETPVPLDDYKGQYY